MEVTVYCIKDDCGRVRYVGQTKRAIEDRMKSHRGMYEHTAKSMAMRAAILCGSTMTIEALEMCNLADRYSTESKHVASHAGRWLLNAKHWERHITDCGVPRDIPEAFLRAAWLALAPWKSVSRRSRSNSAVVCQCLINTFPLLDFFPEAPGWIMHACESGCDRYKPIHLYN